MLEETTPEINLATQDLTIARCPHTQARLGKDHTHYTLTCPQPWVMRNWSRRQVRSDEDAIAIANMMLLNSLELAQDLRS